MSFANLPDSLYKMFNELKDRLDKLERSNRFTAPNVASDPTAPRKGDIILNTAGNQLKYVDNTGSFVALGASTGVSTVTATAPITSTGGTTPNIALTNVGTAGTYTKVTTDASGRVSSGTTLVANDIPGTLNGSTFAGLVVGKTNTGGTVAVSNDSGSLSVRGDGTNSAVVSFHRPGIYAINMGLDTDNGFKIGGWSQGGTPYFQMNTSGHMYLPTQPTINGSCTNTTTTSGFATTFYAVTNVGMTIGSDRVTVPSAGNYLITFNMISNSSSTRTDMYIAINGGNQIYTLSEDLTTGYHYRGASIVRTLAANDYIQFNSGNWYNNTNAAYEPWRTFSITKLS